ncbi:hypothetical protein C8J57DRAFT_498899 [Mycena rebaudengoi]|nr:hypothetical protein C8J57DRAFT_498899 [Mycena rebaudengoi]
MRWCSWGLSRPAPYALDIAPHLLSAPLALAHRPVYSALTPLPSHLRHQARALAFSVCTDGPLCVLPPCREEEALLPALPRRPSPRCPCPVAPFTSAFQAVPRLPRQRPPLSTPRAPPPDPRPSPFTVRARPRAIVVPPPRPRRARLRGRPPRSTAPRTARSTRRMYSHTSTSSVKHDLGPLSYLRCAQAKLFVRVPADLCAACVPRRSARPALLQHPQPSSAAARLPRVPHPPSIAPSTSRTFCAPCITLLGPPRQRR